jgi:DNA-binding cell septation regulator SpoVG
MQSTTTTGPMAMAEISDIRISSNARTNAKGSRLLGYCSVTVSGFVIRDIKILRGKGGMFLSMPSHPAKDRCPDCGQKNDVQAPFCNWCGVALGFNRAATDARGRPLLYHDTVFPSNPEARAAIESAVFRAFDECQAPTIPLVASDDPYIPRLAREA